MKKLPFEIANKLLRYEPRTGKFFWRVSRGGRMAGSEAGHLEFHGRSRRRYLVIRIGGLWQAARVAWLLMTGEMPDGNIDHRDTDSENNRWRNLRLATVRQNTHNSVRRSNNKSGFKGVSWDRENRKWVARIRVPNGRYRNLGRFNSPRKAHRRYVAEAKRLFGEFSRAA